MECKRVSALLGSATFLVFASNPLLADQVINDDLVVIGNACVGVDCVNDMAFGNNQMVLQENNTRIGFSANGAFILTANESTNGGASEFRLDTRIAVSNSGVTGSTFGGFIGNTGVTELLDGSLRVDLSQSALNVQITDPALDGLTDLDTELTPGQIVIIPAGEWTAISTIYSINNTVVTEEGGAGFSYSGDGATRNLSFAGDGNSVTLGRGSETVDGAVSVGAAGSERQIKQVADAVEDDDLINMRQFAGLGSTGAAESQAEEISSAFDRIDTVLATTAALSALQPNPRATNPLSFSLGLGHYEGETAVAAGVSWQASDAMFVRVGIAGSEQTSPQTSLSLSLTW